MEKACSTIKVEENIKDSGSMIKNMDMESLTTQMEIVIREPGEMVSVLTTEFTSIQTEMFTMENGVTIRNKVMEN